MLAELLLVLLAQGPASMPTSMPAMGAPPVAEGVTEVTVAVSHVGAGGAAPAGGVPVTLQALPASGDTPMAEWFGVTGPDGRAVLPGVGVHNGARYVASALADEVAYDSRPIPLQVGRAVTMPVSTYPRTGDRAGVRVARVFTRVALWEGQLEVHQAWTFINAGQATYDPALDQTAPDKGLLVRLPEGAQGAQVDGLPADQHSVAGTKVLYTGKLRPGPEGAVEIRVSFGLEYKGPTYSFVQPAAHPVDELMTLVPDVPTVRHKRLEGVRLSVGAHNHGSLESATERGSAVWVLSGAPASQEIRFEVGGLPHYDVRPAYAALIASVAIIVWGFVRIMSRGGSSPASAPPGAPTPAGLSPRAAADLRRRREGLMDKLMGLERAKEGGGMDDDDFRRRRDAIKRRLIDVDRRLEGAS